MTLRQNAPERFKVAGRQAALALGRRSHLVRMTPDFVLAGGQRCGTTSLFRSFLAHPAVVGPVFHKGVNYFDVNYDKGWRWYQAHFPVRSFATLRTRAPGAPVTFDASGYYSYHPHAPTRLARDLPDVKVLLMVRDPVERAFSAYKHEFARGFETEQFERALELEDERVQPELDRMLADPTYQSFSHRHHSYRRRGRYAEQIQRFTDLLGRERVLVVDSHDFFDSPAEEFSRITDFLGLPPYVPRSFDRWNARPSEPMPDRVRRWLSNYFEPLDRELETMLGATPSWRR